MLKTGAFETVEEASAIDAEYTTSQGEFDSEKIAATIEGLQHEINVVEFRKKMRRSGVENRVSGKQEFEDDGGFERLSSNEKIIIDNVPPKVRRDLKEQA